MEINNDNKMVPKAGLEPAQPEDRGILSPEFLADICFIIQRVTAF